MTKHPISALVFDFTLYPRGSLDSHHVTEISQAILAGVTMPPIVIDAKSKRVIDGFHRGHGLKRLYGESYETECVEKRYKNEAAMFVDAMRYNASHGRALSAHDKAHCLLLAEKLSIDMATVGSALNLTPERIGEIRASKIGTVQGQSIALKNTIRHMAGEQLSNAQSAANDKLGGMNQLFYVNQLVTLLQNGLIDTANEDLQRGLLRLLDLLNEFARAKAA